MLELTKFLGLRNEFLSQKVPIRNNALAQVRITFRVNVLPIAEVISFGINGVGSFNSIPLEIVFRILAIALIGSWMCPSTKVQKDVIDDVTGWLSTFNTWRLM